MDPPMLAHERFRFLVSESWPLFFLYSPGRFIPKVWKCLFIYLSFVKKIDFVFGLTVQHQFSSVQSLSRVWLFVTPWIAARQASLEFTQTHVHRVCDAIQPSHPLSSPSPLACLNRFFRPHVIVQSLPTVRGMKCSKLSKYRFLWAVKRLIRNCIGEGFFTCWANVCC